MSYRMHQVSLITWLTTTDKNAVTFDLLIECMTAEDVIRLNHLQLDLKKGSGRF